MIRPSVSEKQRLLELFKIYQFGETQFEEVQRIRAYIQQLEDDTTVLLREPSLSLDGIAEIHDERTMGDVVLALLSEAWGRATVKIMCQPQFRKLLDGLIALSDREASPVQQLVCFNNDYKTDGNVYNIQCLQLLDKLAIRNPQHSIRYFYDKVNARANALTVFPFFILGRGHALLLSHDFRSGYLTADEHLIAKLGKEFDRIYQQTEELFQVIRDDMEYIRICAEIESSTRKSYYTLQFHPCVLFNYDEKITASTIRDELPFKEQLLGCIVGRWKRMESIMGYHIHSAKGTADFMEHGLTSDMSTEMFRPVAEADRAAVMNVVHRNTEQVGLTMNEEFLSIPRSLTIACYDSGIVLICYRNQNESRLVLRERSLYKSMMSFFSYIHRFETTS